MEKPLIRRCLLNGGSGGEDGKQSPPLLESKGNWEETGAWRARWVSCRGAGDPPFATAYRLHFSLAAAASVRIHVSADERYELYVDGQLAGRGPERGDINHWCYETYECELSAGRHVLAARVWSLGGQAPLAQQSFRPGFILAAEPPFEELLSTGAAAWEAKRLPGLEFAPSANWCIQATGLRNIFNLAEYPEGVETGDGDGFEAVVHGSHGQESSLAGHFCSPPYLYPAMLPPMLDEPRRIGAVALACHASPDEASPKAVAANHDRQLADACSRLLSADTPLELPQDTDVWILLDLGDYYCLYPEIVFGGGAGSRVAIEFSESLTLAPDNPAAGKGDRGAWDGKYWTEYHGDEFHGDGGGLPRVVRPLWFRVGRWMSIRASSGTSSMTINSLRLFETRYPFEPPADFAAESPVFAETAPIMGRTLQMCMHETFFDCPYYEQLMYVGDTRLQVLIVLALSGDPRLPRKAVRMFNWSRTHLGLTASRYPASGRQVIPPFSLIWIAMSRDCAMWSDSADLALECLPGVRAVIDYWETMRRGDGLVASPPGWNFVDWCRPEGAAALGPDAPRWGLVDGGVKWDVGTPPEGHHPGVSGVLNILYTYILGFAAELEEDFGEPEFAARCRRLRRQTFESHREHFFSVAAGLYADNLDHTLFSEHSQCLALLCGLLPAGEDLRLAENLFSPPQPMATTTYYFSHYYFEACRLAGRIDKLMSRLEAWRGFVKMGMKTALEEPEPSRSDCHAWSSHPLFHWNATILGVRPAAPGFKEVEIRPQLGELARASGAIPHPEGTIKVEFNQFSGRLSGEIHLPDGVKGTLVANGFSRPISGGTTTF